MTKETMHEILALFDQAKINPEYMALHAEYVSAQVAFASLLEQLPEQEREVVEEYLRTSVALFYRLLEMAFRAIRE